MVRSEGEDFTRSHCRPDGDGLLRLLSDRYVLSDCSNRGMGLVYEASSLRDRLVAIKMLVPEPSGHQSVMMILSRKQYDGVSCPRCARL